MTFKEPIKSANLKTQYESSELKLNETGVHICARKVKMSEVLSMR